jgi:hypothetical protein
MTTQMIDGQPYFAHLDGVPMNRRQYLDATRDDRKAAFVAALRAEAEPEPDNEPEPEAESAPKCTARDGVPGLD